MIEVFEKLASTSATSEKEKILKENKNNVEFKELLKLNLDPYKNYYINKLSIKTSGTAPGDHQQFKQLLDNLSERKITGNEAKKSCADFFSRITPEYQKLYKKILLKEALGVGVKTVNKVFGKDFVPEFAVMLAPNELANIDTINYPTYIQPKLDGFRCVCIPTDSGFQFYSRRGKAFGNKSLQAYFEGLNTVGSFVLDGEFYSHGTSFDNIASILSTEDMKVPEGLKFHVFDCVPLKDWNLQSSKQNYKERLKKLREIVNNVGDYSKVIDVPTDLCASSAEVKKAYSEFLKQGYEGAMVKDPNSTYHWKRVTAKNGSMLKLKPFQTIDVKIESLYDGEGTFEGMAGGIVFSNPETGVSVRCGSGFSYDLRRQMMHNPELFIDKFVEIKYFETTQDGSLRFPTFIRMRPDKD